MTDEYWIWRHKLLNNNFAVRYPNGFRGRRHCLSLLDDNGKFLDYVAGRQVYIESYTKGDVRQHPLYRELEDKLRAGENLLILEVDGPRYHRTEPYNTLPEGSLAITEEIVKLARNHPKRPFGHGWVLGAMLAGLEDCLN